MREKECVSVFFVGQDLMMPFENLSVNIYLINQHFCACYKQFHLQNLNTVRAVFSAHWELFCQISSEQQKLIICEFIHISSTTRTAFWKLDM